MCPPGSFHDGTDLVFESFVCIVVAQPDRGFSANAEIGFFEILQGPIEAHLGSTEPNLKHIGNFLNGQAGHEFQNHDFAVGLFELAEGILDPGRDPLLLSGLVVVGNHIHGARFIGLFTFAFPDQL